MRIITDCPIAVARCAINACIINESPLVTQVNRVGYEFHALSLSRRGPSIPASPQPPSLLADFLQHQGGDGMGVAIWGFWCWGLARGETMVWAGCEAECCGDSVSLCNLHRAKRYSLVVSSSHAFS